MPPSHRLRVSTWLITTVILLSGCQAAPRPVPPPPAPGPAEVPVTIKSEPAAAAFWVPPDVPLTADLPTYPAEPAAPLGETEIPRGGPDSLRRIAGALEATGAPGTAAGSDARYIGSMAGGRYVYLLNVEPGLYAPTVAKCASPCV